MATLVGVLNMSHSPFCYMPPERWNDVRASRAHRADVPLDDVDTNRKKWDRIQAAFAELRARLAAAAPDASKVRSSACATGLRRMVAWSMPTRWTSST